MVFHAISTTSNAFGAASCLPFGPFGCRAWLIAELLDKGEHKGAVKGEVWLIATVVEAVILPKLSLPHALHIEKETVDLLMLLLSTR